MFLVEPQQTPYDLHFTLAGVPVRVHPMFWLVTVLLGSRNPDPIELLIWVGAVFISILIHEFGHALAFRHYGWRSHIVLYSFGGLAVPDGAHRGFDGYGRGASDARSHIVISFAGPLAGFILAAVILVSLRGAGYDAGIHLNQFPYYYFQRISPAQLDALVGDLLFFSFFWGLVNLLPIYPLDGGQIAQRVLETVNPQDGLRQSLMLSMFTAAGVAILGYVKLDSFFMLLFFGYLAYQNYMTLQSFRGGGYGGRGW